MVMVKMVNLVKLLRNEDRKFNIFNKFNFNIYSLRDYELVETLFRNKEREKRGRLSARRPIKSAEGQGGGHA
jgi:hypothetical protein